MKLKKAPAVAKPVVSIEIVRRFVTQSFGAVRSLLGGLGNAGQFISAMAVIVSIAALHFASKQAHIDQRGWVVVEDPTKKELGAIAPGAPAFNEIQFKFKNVGKTVARDVRIKVISLRAKGLSDDYIQQVLDGRLMPKSESGVQVMLTSFGPPGASDPRRHWPNTLPITLAPNAESLSAFDTTGQEGEPGATPSDPYTYSFLLGRADYTDSLRIKHWMTFCYLYVGKGEFSYCTVGNNEDDNDEPGIVGEWL